MEYPYIITGLGRRFHYGLHDPDEFYMPDIARALSRTCRYNGHMSDKYEDDIFSVAQHSVYVLEYLVRKGAPKYTHRWALTHDCPEGYWTDMVTPLKNMLPEYKHHERLCENAFVRKYDIPFDDGVKAYVKVADYQLFLAESLEMRAVPGDPYQRELPDMTIWEIDPDFYPWRPKKARDEFLAALEKVGIMEN